MERIESQVKRKNLSSEDATKSEEDFREENVEDRMRVISRNSSDADISANFTNIYSEISNLYVSTYRTIRDPFTKILCPSLFVVMVDSNVPEYLLFKYQVVTCQRFLSR